MKRAILLIAMLLVMMIFAAPALAQEGGEKGATTYPAGGKPPPPPPDFDFYNGEVYIQGDSVIGCREFVEEFDTGYDDFGNQRQAKRVIEQCKEAGLPAIEIPPEVRQEMRQDAGHDDLPETGGVPLLTFAAGLLLASAGLLTTYRVIR